MKNFLLAQISSKFMAGEAGKRRES
jgi:hypothetical protein